MTIFTADSEESIQHVAKDMMTAGSLSTDVIKTKSLFSLMELPTELRLKVLLLGVIYKGDEGNSERKVTNLRFIDTFSSPPKI